MKIDPSVYRKDAKKTDKKTRGGVSDISFNRFSDKQKEDFYREFSTLIKAGVDFNQALVILTSQQRSKFLKTLFSNVNQSVVKGKSLFETIKDIPHFSPYEYYSIKIGEETRRLPEVLDELQKFFSRKKKMKRQVVSVMAYPALVLFFTFGVLYFMLKYVVPMFSTVFLQFGKELPKITQYVIKLSDNFNYFLYGFLLLLLLLVILHFAWKDKNKYKHASAKILLSIPFFGDLIRKIYLARFCQSLSLLLAAKTPLTESLELTAKMISLYPLKKAILRSKADILKGETFASSLKKHSFFNAKIVSLTTIGEGINELDKMYDGLSNQYNEDIEHSTKLIGTILEPVMIVVIGAIVGFIMVALYSPIFELSKVIQN
ncbi:type II secretion system F family protein [Olleya sp. HaHaR_3_96]|uniref:type II secretion system F family protein n=1 Tax=Olleya sp. HaHaR_3_96 TaxID=2745560 RepID=UPI001C4F9E76|nr:type II secretion system F family protein [Olleya sp. HaHaR_3_96]QXP58399.1 type II secretion system F family protein [Olleya sp. HaHaR_3_96]